ncbi:hypothetical protein H7K04_06130 [Mycolicibacterium fluoranthenivorans]|nr:hypothetical protein [Mycolicibacterium fluoranthenivorans]
MPQPSAFEVASPSRFVRINTSAPTDEPNDRLAAGRLHANYFQYLPFLEEFNQRTGSALVPVVPVPSDPVNADRSLRMLDGLGLIECTGRPGALASVADVHANPAYAEYLVAAADGVRHPDIQVLAAALNSAATRDFITTAYAGQVIAAF